MRRTFSKNIRSKSVEEPVQNTYYNSSRTRLLKKHQDHGTNPLLQEHQPIQMTWLPTRLGSCQNKSIAVLFLLEPTRTILLKRRNQTLIFHLEKKKKASRWIQEWTSPTVNPSARPLDCPGRSHALVAWKSILQELKLEACNVINYGALGAQAQTSASTPASEMTLLVLFFP